jgi:hypothetical protein
MEGHAKVLLARYRQKKGVNDKRFTIWMRWLMFIILWLGCLCSLYNYIL